MPSGRPGRPTTGRLQYSLSMIGTYRNSFGDGGGDDSLRGDSRFPAEPRVEIFLSLSLRACQSSPIGWGEGAESALRLCLSPLCVSVSLSHASGFSPPRWGSKKSFRFRWEGEFYYVQQPRHTLCVCFYVCLAEEKCEHMSRAAFGQKCYASSQAW